MSPPIQAHTTVESPVLLALAPASAGEGKTERAHHIEELVLRCQSGEPRAFDELVRAIEPSLLRLATVVLGDPVAAEDAFIEAMARVLPRIGDVHSAAFHTYSRRAVRNAAVDLRRSRSYRDSRRALETTARIEAAGPLSAGPLTERVADDGPDPETSFIRAERNDRLRLAVEALREPRRSVVKLRYQEGFSYSEIAEKLDLSESTVKRHLGAARLILASRLRPEGVQHDS